MTTNKNILIAIALLLDEEELKSAVTQTTASRKRRRFWVHEAWKKRGTEGEFNTLYKELVDDERKFYEYFRMSMYSFNVLLNKVKDDIEKKTTFWRKPVPPRERLAVTLR